MKKQLFSLVLLLSFAAIARCETQPSVSRSIPITNDLKKVLSSFGSILKAEPQSAEELKHLYQAIEQESAFVPADIAYKGIMQAQEVLKKNQASLDPKEYCYLSYVLTYYGQQLKTRSPLPPVPENSTEVTIDEVPMPNPMAVTRQGDLTVDQLTVNENIIITTNPSTAASGNIYKDGVPFVHNFSDIGSVFVGLDSGNFTSAGTNNTALGTGTLFQNTANNNTALGTLALTGNTTGESNTAVGSLSLANSSTTNNNTAVGTGALFQSTGGNNTALGAFALTDNTTGSSNIAVGNGAGSELTIGDNNIDIGNIGVAGESGITRLGTFDTQSRTFVAGNIQYKPAAPFTQQLVAIGSSATSQVPVVGVPGAGIKVLAAFVNGGTGTVLGYGFPAALTTHPSAGVYTITLTEPFLAGTTMIVIASAATTPPAVPAPAIVVNAAPDPLALNTTINIRTFVEVAGVLTPANVSFFIAALGFAA